MGGGAVQVGVTPEGTEVPRCQMDPACMDEIRNQPAEHRAQVRTRLSLPPPWVGGLSTPSRWTTKGHARSRLQEAKGAERRWRLLGWVWVGLGYARYSLQGEYRAGGRVDTRPAGVRATHSRGGERWT